MKKFQPPTIDDTHPGPARSSRMFLLRPYKGPFPLVDLRLRRDDPTRRIRIYQVNNPLTWSQPNVFGAFKKLPQTVSSMMTFYNPCLVSNPHSTHIFVFNLPLFGNKLICNYLYHDWDWSGIGLYRACVYTESIQNYILS